MRRESLMQLGDVDGLFSQYDGLDPGAMSNALPGWLGSIQWGRRGTPAVT